MTTDRRLLAGAIGLSLVLAACGGSSTASSGAGAATAAPTEAAPTEAAETEEPATEEPTDTVATDEPTDDSGLGGELNDLATTLPAEAGGLTFERAGYDGDQLGVFGAAAGINSGDLDPILRANGKTLNDVNFAIATSTGEATAMIYAIQIEGVDSTAFAEGLGMSTSTMPSTTLGGKTVYGEAAGGFGVWAYPKDDTLFMLLFVDEQVASAIFEQLP